jgi:hypothetical protein
MKPTYTIKKTTVVPSLQAGWESDVWKQADTVSIDQFLPQSSANHPKTEAKVLYDETNLYVHFRVTERFVYAVTTECQGPVSTDSCVEFFIKPIQPGADYGYFNVEVNCIGTLLLYYIKDSRRTDEGFAAYQQVSEKWCKQIHRATTFTEPITKEITGPVEWSVKYLVPFTLLQAYCSGLLLPDTGTNWQGNFFKCVEHNSRPHWASWSTVGEELNFHQPDKFGDLLFG